RRPCRVCRCGRLLLRAPVCVGELKRPKVPPRALRPVGVVLVDKPAGRSSFALVAELPRRAGARTGPTGTLDPFPTGLLVQFAGAATRLAPCLVGLDKRYVTDVDLRSRTSTGDPEGETVDEHEPPPEAELEQRLARLRGEVELPIPAASAVKVGGERAYRLSRRGIGVGRPGRGPTGYALDGIAHKNGGAGPGRRGTHAGHRGAG